MMGYFSNGTESMEYKTEFCDKCRRQDEEIGCPVWDMHLMYNDEESLKKSSLLHEMIPIDEEGENMQCLFFVKAVI